MDTMFDTLLQLPLFQGLALEDLTSILGKVKLHFEKHKAGDCIRKAGTTCDHFTFILKGEVATVTAPPSSLYSTTEYFPAPHLLEPQSLFGMTIAYASDHMAVDEVHTLTVSKSFVLDELWRYEIFRLNFMNILSNRAQQLASRLWSEPSDTPEGRIIAFLFKHWDRPAGRKLMKIRMEDLARLVNESRATVSKTLNDLQQRGLLELSRGEIFVPEAGNLRK